VSGDVGVRIWPELACPCDGGALELRGEALVCAEQHAYPYVDGIPVMTLDEELSPTQPGYWATAGQIAAVRKVGRPAALDRDAVDPYVAELIVGTHGNLYRHLSTGLPRYPIPDLPLPPGEGRVLLDLGCNWGRWTIAAARAGYRPIGIDPSFEAIVAARRVADQLDTDVRYLVADARRLPFPEETFDVVFSYGVLQHFSRADAALAVHEIARTLRPSGVSVVQMANASGFRNLVQRARRGFREGERFEIRYWRTGELLDTFSAIGPTTVATDGFFTLNPRKSDLDLLPRRYRLLVRTSEALRRASSRAPLLTRFADSLIVRSTRGG
jgi:SAM-dependent methyltransferase